MVDIEETKIIFENPSWEELSKREEGCVFYYSSFGPFRFAILRGFASLSAYFGVPKDCIFHGVSKEQVRNLLPQHGSLSWDGSFPGIDSPEVEEHKDYWWFGWDYAHYGDYLFHFDDHIWERGERVLRNFKKWDVEAVREDSVDGIKSFVRQLIGKDILGHVDYKDFEGKTVYSVPTTYTDGEIIHLAIYRDLMEEALLKLEGDGK